MTTRTVATFNGKRPQNLSLFLSKPQMITVPFFPLISVEAVFNYLSRSRTMGRKQKSKQEEIFGIQEIYCPPAHIQPEVE